MIRHIVLLSLFVPCMAYAQPPSGKTGVDVCIYGGTSAGVIAAYTAAKLHKKVILIEPGNRLGGLSSGGLGFTDIGNKYVVTGLARDFYRRIGQYYGRFEQWTFEPKVAESIFIDYIKRSGCTVIYGKRLKKVIKSGARISTIELENTVDGSSSNTVINAKEYIDCSYEGDLMAASGVSYTTGRESNATYNETVNGVQLKDKHQFPDGIDPYIIPAKPESGLLWGISPGALAETGTGDKKIQAYNFRICLSNDSSNRLPIERPANYDSAKYELLLRYLAARPSKDLGAFLKMDLMPNHKTDINNNGPFSTDMIGMNYQYPDGDYATRTAILQQHEDYTKGLLYFIGHDTRMPEQLRRQMLQWGYPKDEYVNNGHWTSQLYVREARRMLGAYIMTQANCQAKEVVPDGIGMAAYTMDSHNSERMVVNGMVKNEGDVQLKGINPYPVAYRSITPKANECSNLLVPVCLSASHMAYGSIRMEPVFMVLAQSAAVAACQAIDGKTSVQQVNVGQLQARLKSNPLADNSLPEILVDNDDPLHTTIKGDWKKETNGGYGPSFLVHALDNKSIAGVRFTPSVQKTGKYQIYIYCPKLPDAASAIPVSIFDGVKAVNKTINKNDVKVIGQTSGEWVLLATSLLPAGKKAYVEVSTEGADGAVIADAVLFVPVTSTATGWPSPVVNAGVGGNNTVDLLARIEKDCLSWHPRLTILMVGTNDMNSVKYIPPAVYEQNLTALATKITGSGSKLLLLTILPVYEPYLLTRHPAVFYEPEGPAGRRRQMNEIIQRVANKYKLPVLDMEQRFLAVGKIGLDKESLLQNEANTGKTDGVHPTPNGYRFMALSVFDYITGHRLPLSNIVCFGDSITHGDGTTDGESYPAYLNKLINQIIQ